MDDFLKHSEPPAVEFPPNSGIFTAFMDGKYLLKYMQIPDIQRELDPEWVSDLCLKIETEYMNTNIIDLGTFILCWSMYDDKLNLLNGQHRYNVLEQLHQKVTKIPIKIELHKANTKDQMHAIWQRTNRSKSVSIVANHDHQLIYNGFRRHFKTKYAKYITDANKPHKPNINLNHIVDKMQSLDIIVKLSIRTDEDLISKAEELNNYYKKVQYELDLWGKKGWKIPDCERMLEKCRSKSPTNTLYLGLYHNNEWINRLIYACTENISYSQLPHCLSTAKRNASENVKKQVWERWNSFAKIKGRGDCESTCYVCNDPLLLKNAVYGHVIPYFYGGETTVENGRPICGSCNSSMGLENLENYKSRVYPESK